ncbi:MAG: hypothetical protein JWQ33_1602, partial [Ramlibacter sp.]|nr:hypothetical protein [Ramlibacter sp.]
ELAPSAAVTLPAAAAAVAPQPPGTPAATATPPAAATAAAPRGGSGRTAVTRSRRTADAGETPAPRAAAAKAERALSQPLAQRDGGASRARPRLKLDMLELQPERDPSLRPSAGLASAPTTSDQVRAEAAALWRSINAQPEDVLRDLQRVQALESDVKSLRTLVAGNDRTLTELREQLNQARQERSLTLAAIALLTLLLAAMVVTWWLRRGERAGSSREWWRRGEPAAAGTVADTGSVRSGKTAASPGGRVEDVDLRVDESMFESLKSVPRGPQVIETGAPPNPPAVPPRAPASSRSEPNSTFHSSFQFSQAGSMRMVKAEELVDTQQQADFFMSLGQTEQAIEVLETHIRNNAETSALVWLDLMAIYRALKRREDYEALRRDFQRVFNAEVPSYDSTPTVSGGLEDYPRALSRISALWPSPKVMDVIEESIFRKPGADGEPFDLEAYRELVMLYNLGREVVQPPAAHEDWTETDSPASSFFETSMQPLSVARGSGVSLSGQGAGAGIHGTHREAMDTPFDVDSLLGDGEGPETGFLGESRDPQVPRPSPRLGLDIDLSGPPETGKPAPPLAGDTDSNSIDFELSEPGDDAPDGPLLKK